MKTKEELIQFLKEQIADDKESLEDLEGTVGRDNSIACFMYDASIEAYESVLEFLEEQ